MRAQPHRVIGILAFAIMAAHPARAENFGARLSDAALERTQHAVLYDGSYRVIAYPMGDVAPDRGVCADEIIRAYRSLGFDLQKLVHEDMAAHFGIYPHGWGLAQPDTNIDHRRVPNLERFFARHGKSLPLSSDPTAYQAGDIVTWRLNGKLPHIGIVTARRSAQGGHPLIVHNIGLGPQLEDVLFAFPLFGHYRYEG
jgi:uncharacterized protein YijF (DUF1287 family)